MISSPYFFFAQKKEDRYTPTPVHHKVMQRTFLLLPRGQHSQRHGIYQRGPLRCTPVPCRVWLRTHGLGEISHSSPGGCIHNQPPHPDTSDRWYTPCHCSFFCDPELPSIARLALYTRPVAQYFSSSCLLSSFKLQHMLDKHIGLVYNDEVTNICSLSTHDTQHGICLSSDEGKKINVGGCQRLNDVASRWPSTRLQPTTTSAYATFCSILQQIVTKSNVFYRLPTLLHINTQFVGWVKGGSERSCTPMSTILTSPIWALHLDGGAA